VGLSGLLNKDHTVPQSLRSIARTQVVREADIMMTNKIHV
jgi:hypothetical protein